MHTIYFVDNHVQNNLYLLLVLQEWNPTSPSLILEQNTARLQTGNNNNVNGIQGNRKMVAIYMEKLGNQSVQTAE